MICITFLPDQYAIIELNFEEDYNMSMTTYEPKLIINKTAEEVDLFAASQIISQIQKKPDSVLTLPTGSTPVGMYKLLVEAYKKGEIDFSKATICNLDEYWPIDPANSSSYSAYMRKNLIDHINIDAARWYIPDGAALDADVEAKRYDGVVKALSPVDLTILGLGPGTTCHIGFNEKGSAVNSRTRFVTLDEQTHKVNARFFSDPNLIPKGAITQGVGTILESKKIILIAKGEEKAWGINRTLNGPIGSDAPSTFLRYHPDVTILIDEKAAADL